MIINPESLSPGDTVGIVAPASPFDPEKLEIGVRLIREMGFRVKVPDPIPAPAGYLSAPDDFRARQLNQCFADKEIKAIVCTRGGYGSIRILNLLDYRLIRNNPKILVGYSDITVLLTALYCKCGFSVFHGPMAAGLGDVDEDSRNGLYKILTFRDALEYPLKDSSILSSGKAEGPVAGGNLTSLCHLTGTPYMMNFAGHILFLEDRGEALYRIDRMLMHLKLAGSLSGIQGLILGSFQECGDYAGIVNLVLDIFKEENFPILAGFGAGHGGRNLAFPMGMSAILDCDSGFLRFERR
jgi:muramoyltetrapeptide carboxypeptidase